MKALKGILFGVLGMLVLLSLFIVICALNPNLAGSVSNFLYSGNKTETAELNQESASQWSDPASTTDQQPPLIRDMQQQESTLGSISETDYTPPAKTDIKPPEEVAGKNGYEPVKDDTQQIDEEEAKQLEDQLSNGETGDSLTFDTEYYPFYGMLDSSLQKLYRQLYANMMALNATFAPVEQVTTSQLRAVFEAVLNDHPEIFWLDSSYSGKASRGGTCVEITLRFNQTADDLDAAKASFNAAANEILAGAGSLASSYEKEKYVHRELLDKITYDLRAPLNQTAYSALVNQQTVCAGYARAFQYLMQQLGVPCYYSTGFAGENHAWNIIKLDGDYYNVDTTWGDTDPNTYDYFNKTDADYRSTHRREDLSVYLPACNGTRYGNLESNPEVNPEVIPQTADNINPGSVNNNSDNNRRSLEEAGFLDQTVLTNMEDYYTDCYNHIMQNGGSVQFQNVVSDINMWYNCSNAYTGNGAADGYLSRVLSELSADTWDVSIVGEELQDGRILLNHTIYIN